MKTFFVAMLVYVVAVIVASLSIESGVPAPWDLIVALVPLLPGVFVVYAVIQAVRKLDELERRIQLEALVFAFPALFVVLLTESLLGMVGVQPLGPGIEIIVMGILWNLGLLFARRKYK